MVGKTSGPSNGDLAQGVPLVRCGVLLDWLQPFFPAWMDLSILAIYGIVIFAVLAFFREWGPPDVVALACMAGILGLGILPLTDVVEDGEVVERGTHRELVAQKGHYYGLVQYQLELGR